MPQVRASFLEVKNIGSTIEFHDGDIYHAGVIEGFTKKGDKVVIFTNLDELPFIFDANEYIIVGLRNDAFFLHAMGKDLQTLMRGLDIEPDIHPRVAQFN